jgi:50S ribosomal protein L16 3-hydroxylase
MPSLKNNILGTLGPEQFLQGYWQKQPCLIRQALPGCQSPLSPEELAGLACEEGVEARLVVEKGGTHPWQVKYSPLAAKDFSVLPKTRWTLLVQGVEHYHAQINKLLDYFRFIPNWRIDDVMISYAATNGGVGPHLDSYDVFLLQAHGRRRWQINTSDYTEKDFIPGLELRIIGDFNAEQDWVLEPGDMLYLPPGVAHNGIALEPCMTFSIGLLAPARSELVTGFIDDNISGTARDTRFTDPDRRLQKHPGEITRDDLDRVTGMMRSTLADDAMLEEWFGKYITRGPDGSGETRNRHLEESAFRRMFGEKKTIHRCNGVRTAFIRQKGRLLLCINGEILSLAPRYRELAIIITEQAQISYPLLKQHAHFHEFNGVLCGLYNRGVYEFK